jgi:hypothetical protein
LYSALTPSYRSLTAACSVRTHRGLSCPPAGSHCDTLLMTELRCDGCMCCTLHGHCSRCDYPVCVDFPFSERQATAQPLFMVHAMQLRLEFDVSALLMCYCYWLKVNQPRMQFEVYEQKQTGPSHRSNFVQRHRASNVNHYSQYSVHVTSPTKASCQPSLQIILNNP